MPMCWVMVGVGQRDGLLRDSMHTVCVAGERDNSTITGGMHRRYRPRKSQEIGAADSLLDIGSDTILAFHI